MERNEFKSRLKQYKKAREENPGLKYWEWKDIPKYDEGTALVGMPSTTSADGRTKYVYYNPTMDLEYQNIHLPEVTITGNKNAGKRLPMQVPEGSYERFKTLGEIGKTVGSFLPVAGEMIDTYDLATDMKNKDWTNSAIRVGSYFIPNIVEKGWKYGKKLWKYNQVANEFKNIKGKNTIYQPEQTSLYIPETHKLEKLKNTYQEFEKVQYSLLGDKQWDLLYDAAIKQNNLDEAQRLRDLHFAIKSNTVVKNKSTGMPLRTYHTVADQYDPSFTKFNPEIEGSNSAIYTALDPQMSGTYSSAYVSDDEISNLLKYDKRQKDGLSFQMLKDELINKGLWQPQRMKSLYVKLNNPLTVNADGNYWNFIPSANLPDKVLKNTRNINNVVSTRDIEQLYKHFGYDGAIVNVVRDFGPRKPLADRYTPSFVYEIDKPSSLKLTNAITYDDAGKIIPLSKRDDWKNPDIRYSFAPIGLAGLAGYKYTTENKKNNSYAEGGEVEPNKYSERPVIEFDPETGKTTYGYNPGAGYLSDTDPIGEAMMWGLGGGAASAALRSLFPTYGATVGWLAFGDNNKDNMLVVPNNPVKNTTPIETRLLNKEVRQYYADDVLPRDILTSEADKLRFLNTDKNFEYDLYPSGYFNGNVAGHYDPYADKVRLNGGYTTNKDLLDNVMSHEVNHRYNREFPLDKEHNRILNRAYTVEPDLDTNAARAARKPSEKRATNVNIRHKLQTDLRDTLGRKPTKEEIDKFIDSLSDQELLDRLGSASSYGSAYLMSIEDRADLVNQPADQYKKARVTALRKALKRIAMNEDKNDNNQNYA